MSVHDSMLTPWLLGSSYLFVEAPNRGSPSANIKAAMFLILRWSEDMRAESALSCKTAGISLPRRYSNKEPMHIDRMNRPIEIPQLEIQQIQMGCLNHGSGWATCPAVVSSLPPEINRSTTSG